MGCSAPSETNDQGTGAWGARAVYQVADNDLGSGLDGQVEGGELGRVLHPGVDVSLDADEEQDALDVRVLHGHVEEIPPFVVHLGGRRNTQVNTARVHDFCVYSCSGLGSTCSAAPGSLFRMASAALLFLCVMAQAKGVIPWRSRMLRRMSGWEMRSWMMTLCWLLMAAWMAARPSAS